MYDLHFRDITVRGFWLNVVRLPAKTAAALTLPECILRICLYPALLQYKEKTFLESSDGHFAQWLSRLPKDVREKELLEVMDLIADGTLKPPPSRALQLWMLMFARGSCVSICYIMRSLPCWMAYATCQQALPDHMSHPLITLCTACPTVE